MNLSRLHGSVIGSILFSQVVSVQWMDRPETIWPLNALNLSMETYDAFTIRPRSARVTVSIFFYFKQMFQLHIHTYICISYWPWSKPNAQCHPAIMVVIQSGCDGVNSEHGKDEADRRRSMWRTKQNTLLIGFDWNWNLSFFANLKVWLIKMQRSIS